MVTYGFYDSLNGDRKYSAIQFGSMFDGMVLDGVFMSIGTCFRVTPGSGMMIQVGTGRAWFNHTWTLNDAILPLYIDQSELLLNRIDAVVIDVDQRQESRKNDIIVVKGKPATNPVRPTLTNNSLHHQYPLAYITVSAKVTAIRAADIESTLGTSATPYVTGLLKTVNIDNLIDQWKDQWLRFYEQQTKEMRDTNALWKATWKTYYDAQVAEMNATNAQWKATWKAFYDKQVADMENMEALWIETWNEFYNEQTAEILATNEYWKNEWVRYFTEKRDEINATKAAWEVQWQEWFDFFTNRANTSYDQWVATWEAWYKEYTDKMNDQKVKNKQQWDTWFNTYTNENQQDYLTWKDGLQASFDRWFNSLQGSLGGDHATILADKIAKLEEQVRELQEFKDDVVLDNVMWNPLFDNINREILDSEGKIIKAKTLLQVVSRETIEKHS